MSLPNRSVADSSTDRAVLIAVAVLLPAAFSIFVARHLWSEHKPVPIAQSNPTVIANAALQDRPEPPNEVLTTRRRNVPAITSATESALQHPTLFPQASLATAGNQFNTNFSLQHAPTELSATGRIVADPQAFAPAHLAVQEEQALRGELAHVAQVDLYGVDGDSRRRFTEIRKDVLAERSKFQIKRQKLTDEARSGELGRRRLRTDRGRRELQAEISTALFGKEDPFRPPFQPLKNWLHDRNDLQGLPLAMGDECRLDSLEAKTLQTVSTRFGEFRRKLTQLPDPSKKEEIFRKWVQEQRWSFEHIPGLVQVLSAEKEDLRLELVKILANFRYPKATTALARIAVFDLSAQVRWNAVIALRERQPENYRKQLMAGLRYVWPPAADNAAQALVSLDDQAAYEQLVNMVDDSDPRAPYRTNDGHWATRELVGVNHMRNCLLCYAPAVTSNARVTGAFPSPYDPPPRVYYEQNEGNLVRADVTYLRQDFSVVHTVEDHGQWPEHQRFDYLVRERQLTDQEAAELSSKFSDKLYPQRAAVLYAIRKLRPEADPLAARLAITSID